jgi:hypothetical protein
MQSHIRTPLQQVLFFHVDSVECKFKDRAALLAESRGSPAEEIV